ncbi:hypothetical protein [Sinorhizobium americanum]|uniref:Uncharacterized protein n=1 Tax=Sinorhizobium americanum TaxID=194963 RepID=A0A4R2BSM2_9HYPH|nr:hypothetical protein [Sinorhizobium americanum]TCN29119.1 hypothetical protein EV184_111221 [Sinorhizobium americanum]
MVGHEAQAATDTADDFAGAEGLAPKQPVGGRGRLGGTFLDAVQADFAAHGAGVIARIREEKPETYLKLVATITPKDLSATTNAMDELSNEQLIERIRALDTVIRPLLAKKARARRKPTSKP